MGYFSAFPWCNICAKEAHLNGKKSDKYSHVIQKSKVYLFKISRNLPLHQWWRVLKLSSTLNYIGLETQFASRNTLKRPRKPLEIFDKLQIDSKASEEGICRRKKTQQISRCSPLTADRQQQNFDISDTKDHPELKKARKTRAHLGTHKRYFTSIWLSECQIFILPSSKHFSNAVRTLLLCFSLLKSSRNRNKIKTSLCVTC